MKRNLLVALTFIGLSLLPPLNARSEENASSVRRMPPSARLALTLDRGICIDRQFRTIPPERIMRISREDIRLIKSTGFQFVKLIVNPEPLMSNDRLSSSTRWYLQEIVRLVVDEGMPVVVCIHPEWKFKESILSDAGRFSQFVGFLEDTGRFLAAGWGPKQLAFQLMTEPGGNALDWNDLQPRMWQAARRVMPKHTLILAGDEVGKIEGLVKTKPVDDENVMYSFTFYDPFVLTLQGAEWLTPSWWSHLGSVPYPSSPEILRAVKPTILEKVPASPSEWRPTVDRLLTDYGDACWNREKIRARIRRLADWNTSYGGGLKIWCAEFGCFQRTIDPVARYRYIRDVREAFEENGIGWAYWSYNETLTIMTPERQAFGPAESQPPDKRMLDALFGGRGK